MSRVLVHRRASRYLQKLSRNERERVRVVLRRLAQNPNTYPGLIHMAGDWAGYRRIRVGNLRIIFWYDAEEDVVYVDYIGPRGDIYKS